MKVQNILMSVLAALLCSAAVSCSGEQSATTDTTDAVVDSTPVTVPTLPEHDDAEIDAIPEADEADFTYTTANGQATILSYTGDATEVRVPTVLGGCTVTAIGGGAFANDTDLNALILPETVLSMGEGVLENCTAIAYLETPLMGKSADDEQFLAYLFGADSYEDYSKDLPPASLKTVRITGEMTALSDFAFYSCSALQTVLLPDGMTEIGKFAFYNCASLTLIAGLENVKTLGAWAFSDCRALTSVTLGEQTREIGFGAFLNCDALISMKLPFAGGRANENDFLAYIFGAEYADHAKGFYPSGLSRIEILNGCQALGNYAFFECETLKEVVLPETLESIGVRAFAGCEALWSIKLPDSLTTIRENAFWGCDSLLTVTFGESLTAIGINAFYNCDSLTEITLPMSLQKLPASCFAGCRSLTTVDLGGVREVGAQAFRHCDKIETVKTSGVVTFAEGNDAVKKIVENK